FDRVWSIGPSPIRRRCLVYLPALNWSSSRICECIVVLSQNIPSRCRRCNMRRNLQYLSAAALVVAGASVVLTYARARQIDVNLLCVSRAKQLAAACLAYTQDYDEKFPISMTQADLRAEVNPYVRDPAVF